MAHYDDPVDLARLVGRRPPPLLIGLDVDGVLAPIVGHAADAALLPGIAEAIGHVARLVDVHVAVVSGRSVSDLERFGFADHVHVIGSHGAETRDVAMAPLDAHERLVLQALDDAAVAAAARAGAGAWIERKPASVVLHVRQADASQGPSAVAALIDTVGSIEGATTKIGSGVIESFARHADKGTALVDLADRLGAATTVFVGDDITDEEAFARLGVDDVSIKVGAADTIAAYRLDDPGAVLAWLHAIAGQNSDD